MIGGKKPGGTKDCAWSQPQLKGQFIRRGNTLTRSGTGRVSRGVRDISTSAPRQSSQPEKSDRAFIMPVSVPPSATPSRTSTPAPNHNARFTSQTSTAEDLLKSQTVGLVHLSDFRKRRAEALEQKEREAEDRSLGRFASAGTSGTATPTGDG